MRTRRAIVLQGMAVAVSSCATTAPARPRAVALGDVEVVAAELARPEGIVVTRDGRIIVASTQAACTIIEPSGARRSVGSAWHANGLAMDRQGRVIVANYGLLNNVPGGLQRVDLASGDTVALAAAIEGRALTSSNAPAIGPDGIYCTHTQWSDPTIIGAVDPQGFVYKVADNGAVSLVCAGLRMANGLCFSADFAHLYVAQTAAGNVVRLARRADGGYGEPMVWGGQLGHAPENMRAAEIRALPPAERNRCAYPDGVALDVAGNLWLTLPFANRVVALTPAGEVIDVINDIAGEKLQMPTNLAFGGPDLRDLYVASMGNHSVVKARVNIAGVPLPHWTI